MNSVTIEDRRPKSGGRPASLEASGRNIISVDQLVECGKRGAALLMEGGLTHIRAAGFTDGIVPPHHRRYKVDLAPAGQLVTGLVNIGKSERNYINDIITAAGEVHRAQSQNQFGVKWAVESVTVWRGYHTVMVPRADQDQTSMARELGIDLAVDKGVSIITEADLARNTVSANKEMQEVLGYSITFVALDDVPEVLRVGGEPKVHEQFVARGNNGNTSAEQIGTVIGDKLAAALSNITPAPVKEAAEGDGERLHHKTKEKYERELADLRAQLAAKEGAK